MSDYTYETGETVKFETYEWDRLWWEHANDTESKNRILIIGDSISCGYRPLVNQEVADYVDGIGTSKGLDNTSYITLLNYFMDAFSCYKIIQFNNGLHGWHLSEERYEEYYRRLIAHLVQKCPGAKLVLALTTPVNSGNQKEERNEKIRKRNEIARKIAQEEGLCVNDLHTPISEHPEFFSQDGVHLTQEGYTTLAKQCAELFASL